MLFEIGERGQPGTAIVTGWNNSCTLDRVDATKDLLLIIDNDLISLI